MQAGCIEFNQKITQQNDIRRLFSKIIVKSVKVVLFLQTTIVGCIDAIVTSCDWKMCNIQQYIMSNVGFSAMHFFLIGKAMKK